MIILRGVRESSSYYSTVLAINATCSWIASPVCIPAVALQALIKTLGAHPGPTLLSRPMRNRDG
jgi:hypothetical protein